MTLIIHQSAELGCGAKSKGDLLKYKKVLSGQRCALEKGAQQLRDLKFSELKEPPGDLQRF